MFDLTLQLALAVIVAAFLVEYIDATLGMGAGTALTPILLLLGFSPYQIIPMMLFSELAAGFLAGVFHQFYGNIDVTPDHFSAGKFIYDTRKNGIVHAFDNILPKQMKLLMLFAILSVIGSFISVLVSINLPETLLKAYIGLLIAGMGIFILYTRKQGFSFSWLKVTIAGLVASFNKALTGGSYGPIITGSQMLTGIDGDHAVGITVFSEGFTSLIAFIFYVILRPDLDWTLAPYILIGILPAAPLSAFTVNKIDTNYLTIIISIVMVVLGVITLIGIL